jgi:hypothetical protein
MTGMDPVPVQAPRKDMSVWGIGPRLVVFTSPYAVPALIAQWTACPRFVTQGPPVAVFAAAGSAGREDGS